MDNSSLIARKPLRAHLDFALPFRNVIIKLDHLEKIGLHLEFKEIESLKMVSNGLNDALTEVRDLASTTSARVESGASPL